MASHLKRTTPRAWQIYQMRRNTSAARSTRKRRHRAQNCWCSGWWWEAKGGPHRLGSMASENLFKDLGSPGCHYGKPPAYLENY